MHYPKNSLIIVMMALFLGLIIDILISNAISLEGNQKLLLVSANSLQLVILSVIPLKITRIILKNPYQSKIIKNLQIR